MARVVLIIRNPLDTYKAEYNRRKTHGSHTAAVDILSDQCKCPFYCHPQNRAVMCHMTSLVTPNYYSTL